MTPKNEGKQLDSEESGSEMTQTSPFLFSTRMSITVMCFFAVSTMMCLRLNMSMTIVPMINHTYLDTSGLQTHDNNIDSNSSSSNKNFSIVTVNSNIANSSVDVDSEPGSLDVTVRAPLNTTFHSPRSLSGLGTERENAIPSRYASGTDVNATKADQEDGPLTWDKAEQGQVLGAYYYGYVIAQIPAGWLVRKVGGKRLILASSLAASVICLCMPIVALHNVVGVIILRVLTGIMGGVICPAAQHVISHWSPPLERSVMGAFTFAGFPCGTLVAFALAGPLCKYGFAGGWPSVFYIFGILGFTFCLSWALLVSDIPESHGRIKEAEKEYIRTSLLGNVEGHKQHSSTIPWRDILTSLPVYAIIVAGIATDFIQSMFLLYLPTYLAEVMHFDITTNGLISSMPYIVCFLTLNFSGYFSDLLIKRTRLTTGAVRKIGFAFGTVLCIGSLLTIGFIDSEHAQIAVALLILSVSATGFMTVNYYVNPLDIAPEYSGLLVGLAVTVGSMTGFISPAVVGAITSQGSGLESWRIVFLTSACVEGLALLFYVIFASGEIQPWARPLQDVEPEDQGNGVAVSNPAERLSTREADGAGKYGTVTDREEHNAADTVHNVAV